MIYRHTCSNIEHYFDNIGYLTIFKFWVFVCLFPFFFQVFVFIGDNNWWGGRAGCCTFCSLSYLHFAPSQPASPGSGCSHTRSYSRWVYFLELTSKDARLTGMKAPQHRKGCRKGPLGILLYCCLLLMTFHFWLPWNFLRKWSNFS